MGRDVREVEREIAEGILASVQNIRALILKQGQLLEEAKGTRDAYPMAGHLARLLDEAGGRLDDNNPHKLVWPFDKTRRLNDPQGYEATFAVVELLTRILGAKSGAVGSLREAAELWPECANRAEIEKVLAARRQLAAPPPPAPAPARPATRDTMPVVAHPSPPPGKWVDGEYRTEEFVQEPLVG